METQPTPTAPLTPASKVERAVTALVKAEVAVGNRGVILNDIDGLYRFSTAVANSGLCPKDFIGKPDSVMVAIQMGMELGLTPMAAMQNIAVINGRPAVWGDAMLAIVRSTGQLKKFIELETNDELEVIFRELAYITDEKERLALLKKIAVSQAKMNRNAEDFGGSVFLQRDGYDGVFGRFTVADAKRANLWGKAGPWTQYPARMCKWRARGFILRDNFGDALKGMLSAEEVGDMDEEIPHAVIGQTRRVRTPRRMNSVVIDSMASPAEPGAAALEQPENVTSFDQAAEAVKSDAATAGAEVASEPVREPEPTPDYLPDLDNPDKSIFELIKRTPGMTEKKVLAYLVKYGKAKPDQELLNLSMEKLRTVCAHWKSVVAEIDGKETV